MQILVLGFGPSKNLVLLLLSFVPNATTKTIGVRGSRESNSSVRELGFVCAIHSAKYSTVSGSDGSLSNKLGSFQLSNEGGHSEVKRYALDPREIEVFFN